MREKGPVDQEVKIDGASTHEGLAVPADAEEAFESDPPANTAVITILSGIELAEQSGISFEQLN